MILVTHLCGNGDVSSWCLTLALILPRISLSRDVRTSSNIYNSDSKKNAPPNMHLWEAKYAPLRGKQDEDGPRSRLDHQGLLAFLQGVSHCGTLGFGFSGWFHKPWISGKTNRWEMLVLNLDPCVTEKREMEKIIWNSQDENAIIYVGEF